MIESDGVDDVSISVNSSPSKVIGCNAAFSDGLPIGSSGVLCAKASMLLQVSFMGQFKFVFLTIFPILRSIVAMTVGRLSAFAAAVFTRAPVTVG
jgi:hypothetical protein